MWAGRNWRAGTLGGLSAEDAEALAAARPATLAAAARVPGVTPAAMVALLRHVKRSRGRAPAPQPPLRRHTAAAEA